MKKFLIGFATVLLCFSLQLPATGTQEKKVEDVSSNTIKVALSSTIVPWVQEAATAYMEENPNVVIKVIEIPSTSDMYTKITMMMQSPQTCPDLITEDGFMINADSAAGYLAPLDEMCKAWPDVKYIDPTVLKGGKGIDGKQYGIPYSTDVQCIWYNKELMKQAGVSVPFEPKNWNEILVAAKKLKALGKPNLIPVFLFASKSAPEETSMRTFQTLYSGTGGQLYDYNTSKWIVDRANLKKVFEFINAIYNTEKVGPELSIAVQSNISSIFRSDYMKNEKLGMLFSGSWEASNWGKGKQYEWPEGLDVWGIAKIPTSDGQAPNFTTMSGGWTWAVPAKANNKEGGQDFLKYMSNKENSLKYAILTGDLAVRSDVIADTRYTSQDMAVVKEAAKMMQYTHFRPSVGKYSTLTAMFTEVVESIAMGTATPAEAVTTFESEMIRIVGKDNVIVK